MFEVVVKLKDLRGVFKVILGLLDALVCGEVLGVGSNGGN